MEKIGLPKEESKLAILSIIETRSTKLTTKLATKLAKQKPGSSEPGFTGKFPQRLTREVVTPLSDWVFCLVSGAGLRFFLESLSTGIEKVKGGDSLLLL